MDPRAIGAGLLAKGIVSQPVMPNGSSFRGEEGLMGSYGPFGPIVTFSQGGPFANPIPMPLWPNPVFAWPGAFGDAIWNPGYNFGLGAMGMYGVNLYVAGIYADMKFFDDKLQIKGEFDRIWGAAHINAYGRGYNAFLNDVATATLGVTPGPITMGGLPTTIIFTNLLPGQKIPEKIGVDSTNVYVDISYNTDLFTVGAAFLYGSGEKWGHPFTQHHLGINTTGNDDFHWSNIVVAGDWQWLNSTAPLGLGSNQENVTSAKLYWAVRPFESLDIHGAVLWAKYTEPVGRYAMDENMNLVSNYHAFYGHPMNYVLLPGNHTYIPANVDDDLGWELDFGVTWTIMEGLSLNSEFGVLFTGDAFDYRNTETGAREKWGEIYRWVNTLTYEF